MFNVNIKTKIDKMKKEAKEYNVFLYKLSYLGDDLLDNYKDDLNEIEYNLSVFVSDFYYFYAFKYIMFKYVIQIIKNKYKFTREKVDKINYCLKASFNSSNLFENINKTLILQEKATKYEKKLFDLLKQYKDFETDFFLADIERAEEFADEADGIGDLRDIFDAYLSKYIKDKTSLDALYYLL